MAAACSGPAPPKATSASPRGSMPRSTVTTRTAWAISEPDTRTIPAAVSSVESPSSEARRSDGPLGRGPVERHTAGQRRVGVEVAQQQVGVRHRGLLAAAAVAGGAGVGSGRARAGAQRSAAVAPGDAAAARAHGVHVHHRQRQRATADLAAAGDRHAAVEHQRDVARGAAHVESHAPPRRLPAGPRARRPRPRPPDRRAPSRHRGRRRSRRLPHRRSRASPRGRGAPPRRVRSASWER